MAVGGAVGMAAYEAALGALGAAQASPKPKA
jgi:hypothetical protein